MKSFQKHYLSEASVNTENVREGIISYINEALLSVSSTGGLAATIKIGNHNIKNVVVAKPARHTSSSGIEPYVDIDLVLTNKSIVTVGIRVAKSKKFMLYRGNQLSNNAIPAFRRGIDSLDKIYPDAREHFISSLLDFYTTKGYTHGTEIEDTVYGKIDGKLKETILLGDLKYGGRLDYLFAIDQASFTWRNMRIPKMTHYLKKHEFVIEIKNTRAFSASEIMANNDVYMWAASRDKHLYLGSDRLDTNNLPAIFGPPHGDAKEYGIKRYRVGLNIRTKESFVVKDNTQVFKLELKHPNDINPEEPHQLPAGSDREDQKRLPRRTGGGYMGRSHTDPNLDKEEYGETLSPDAREDMITSILSAAVRGMRHRFKMDLEDEQKEKIRTTLEKLSDEDLRIMLAKPSHRLASDIKDHYLT